MKKITRRSFIKKSTAAGIAAANVTVLSGLINAAEGGGSGSYPSGYNCTTKRNPQTFRIKVYKANGGPNDWSWHSVDKVECLGPSGSYILPPDGGLKWWTNLQECTGNECNNLPETNTAYPYCA